MKDSSASRAEAGARPSGTVRILVWDAPVRVFHWLMVISFAGAWLTAESERWRLLHVTFGYTMIGLVCFRIVWGMVGTRYARFAEFVRSPAAIVRYLASLAKGQPQRHVGHNPAGAVAIIAMLLMTCVVAVTGWAAYNGAAGEWAEEIHEGAASAMLALVIVHVAAVLISSLLHRENLVSAMVTGYKSGRTGEGIRKARWWIAFAVAAGVAGWWAQSGATAPPVSADQASASAAVSHPRPDREDD